MGHRFTRDRPLTDSLKEYGRGIAGGLIFSFPLLYTMEIWWHGFIAAPLQLIALIAATFLLLLGYNRYAGMHPDASFGSVLVDSVEEMGLGLAVSFGVLLMLGRIKLSGMGLDEVVGKVTLEAMAVSIGISVGTAQLGAGKTSEGDEGEGDKPRREGRLRTAVLALCGAVLVGGNVAPTEEIPMIAFEAGPRHILAMVVASLLLSAMVVFYSNFRGSQREAPENMAYTIAFDVCISYLAALGSSAFLLWFFGRLENTAFEEAFAQCVVLGVIATLGASAGRLLIK